jgi:pimeloyl-ACP methyl ester carboxylesterase
MTSGSESTIDGDRLVEISGRKVRVRVHGDGPPVLLINGLGGNVATWTSLVRDLEGIQVISFDAPGAGRSDSPLAPYTMGHVADVAAAVLDETGHDRADVLGYSFGGAVAQTLAHRSPDRVRRLVLAGTSCGVGAVPGSVRALMAVTTPLRQYSRTGYGLMMKMLELAPAEEENQNLMEQTAAWHREAPPSPLGYLWQVAAFSNFNSLPWLHEVEQPTLVITGTHDRLVPMANSAILAAYLPHARMRVVERWGHYLLNDQRSGAGAAIADFVRADDHAASSTWAEARELDRETMEGFVKAAPLTAHVGRYTGGLVRLLHPPRTARD